MIESDHFILGVVPVFINTGAAVLPAIAGPILAAAANIFRPRVFIQIIRRNPAIFLFLFLFCGLLGVGGWILFSEPADQAKTVGVKPTTRFDWAQWARSRIENPGIDASTRPVVEPGRNTIPATQPVYFRFNAKRTGSDGVDVGIPMRQVWNVRPEPGAVYFSSPTLFNDRLYIGCYIPGLAEAFGTVLCLDTRTGGVIWVKRNFKETELKPIFSSPAISADGKSLVIGEGFHEDENSRLLCFDAETGNEKWAVQTPLHIESSPAIFNDLAVVGCGAMEDGPQRLPKSHPGFILAVGIFDGRERWRHTVNDPEASVVFDPSGNIYVGSGFNGNAVVALRSDDPAELERKGLTREIWRVSTPYPMISGLAYDGGVVYSAGGESDYTTERGKGGGVFAIEADSGRVIWSRELEHTVIGPVSIADNRVLCPVWDGQVTALSREDGTVVWEQRVSGENPVLAGLCVGEKRAIAASSNGVLAIMRLSDGGIEQRIVLRNAGTCISSPGSLRGVVYHATEHEIRAFRAMEGE